MTDKTTKNYPAFKGLRWYCEQYFSFFIPIDWSRFNWQDDRQGVLFGPSAEDAHTIFAVDLTDLGFSVSVDDLDDLYDGFLTSIQQLSEVEIELCEKQVVGALISLEAKYTFIEDEMTRKRWVRVLYHGTRQVVFTAQGTTPEVYDYWLPMFFEAMMTAKVHSTKPTDV
ncbi:hypothetical protein ACFLYO_00990 [Chloroflexota bacterium]